MLTAADLRISDLGPCTLPSPLATATIPGGFVPDDARLPLDVEEIPGEPRRPDLAFQKAGPRARVFFEPAKLRVAVLTAGGLCPGLNNVIRSLVMQLKYGYGVEDVLGVRYGFAGLDPASGHAPVALTSEVVADIHRLGGTMLGTSRVHVASEIALQTLMDRDVHLLFAIGGDGTFRGAHALHLAAASRGYPLAVVGIPKTIDNDIPYVWRSFGYLTAVEKAREVIDSAHSEAKSHHNGVGLVRLMGRHAGFIAAGATLASQEVNFCLVPEVPFSLESFLPALRARLQRRRHAVIVVAEGAGQDLIPDGDPRYAPHGSNHLKDIGAFLRDRIVADGNASGVRPDLKYFDPTYFIRSAPADSEDALFCDQLARHAVHAGMAGKTDALVGYWYNVVTHVPFGLVVNDKRCIVETNEIWRSVLQTTGQPARFE